MTTFMPQMRTRSWLVLVLLVAIGGSTGWFVVERGDALPDDAVFRVHGEVVTETDLDDRLSVLEALYGVERPQGAREDEFVRDAAKSMAVSMILDRAAEEHDVVVSDQEARTALARAIDTQPAGRAGFVDFLAQSGLSEADVLDEIRLQLETTQLVEAVTADVEEVTPADVRAYYDDHQDRMVAPEKRELRNIVVTTRGDAERVLRAAQHGETFASLALTWSRDTSTRDKGGRLGTLAAEQLEPPYAEAAFTVRPGALFGPVRTQHGWNVGQVVSVVPARHLSFPDVEQRLAEDLNAQRLLDAWRGWLADQIEQADVEYADNYRPEDPDAPPAELPE